MRLKRILGFVFIVSLLGGCDLPVMNSPYPESESKQKILYGSFAERPKTLDPAKAYSSNEYQFISQIYEPLLQYDYFKRPYTLVPLAAKKMPTIQYFDAANHEVPETSDAVVFSRYDIHLRHDLQFQPHPAFAVKNGTALYLSLPEHYVESHGVKRLDYFNVHGTRMVTADDYIFQIKRLADSRVHSPIYGIMKKNIVGFGNFSNALEEARQIAGNQTIQTLYNRPMEGVRRLSDYHFQITIKGKNPEFMYWLSMPFFSPMAPEVVAFYQQPGFSEVNLNLDWFPVGSGPYYLKENNPNREMVLTRNPNFHQERFPTPTDAALQQKYKQWIGKPLPFIDEVKFVLEKESIPRWNKFLQGYYDKSAVSADSFDQAFSVDEKGQIVLTPAIRDKDITLYSAVEPTLFYMGFNMLDKVVGGNSDANRKLREAISIAVDFKEYISIFMNGRGLVAGGPIPPGISGYEDTLSSYNHDIFKREGPEVVRRDISYAKTLLASAGYPNGINEKSGKRLILNYDVPASSSPDDKARLNWYRKQLKKIGINLHIRATQYNRFQEKMRNGNAQLFSWGWHADYPSPENFLFLLYGPNGKVKFGGENAANYHNQQFDRLFEQFKTLSLGKERDQLVKKMIAIAQADAPWIWGVYPKSFLLAQSWNGPVQVSTIGDKTLKYMDIDVVKRNEQRLAWNQPLLWPIALVFLMLMVILMPVWISYRKKEHQPIRRI